MPREADIYFCEAYGKLYERAEGGRAVCFCYDGAEGCVRHLFILREIPIAAEGGPWYDTVTPYGYGGPLMTRVGEGYTKKDLEGAFDKAFSAYCAEQRIVCEFVRFHPILQNALDFRETYNAVCIRHTLGTDLTLDDPVGEEFSKECRRKIRRASNAGVCFRVTEAPADLSVFREIYYATMDRNGAGEYYYFDEQYFADCQRELGQHLLLAEAVLEGKTVAAGLYFAYGDTVHIHLSGTRSEYLYLSPACILRHGITLWAKERGFSMIHHGGGRSNAEDDALYSFKRQFAQKTKFDFYVGKRIWNKTAYNALCQAANAEEGEFFPAYRAPRTEEKRSQ